MGPISGAPTPRRRWLLAFLATGALCAGCLTQEEWNQLGSAIAKGLQGVAHA